jgi:predicted membrane-bound spermidine synthase
MMGATYPLMMSFLKGSDPAGSGTSFSLLYLANVIGAMAGTFASAFVLVELLGFTGTLAIGGFLNLALALACAWYARSLRRDSLFPTAPEAPPSSAGETRGLRTAGVILFASGFTTLALEIVWTRMFTPALRTSVYAFASLLIVYLAATWAGSSLYRAGLVRGRTIPLPRLLLAAMVTVFLPAVLNDPRWFFNPVGNARAIVSLASIVPFCAVLGYLTPRLIDDGSRGVPRIAGRLYAINIVGCIAGPLAASYLLLPRFGAKHSLALLGAPYILLFLFSSRTLGTRTRMAAAVAGVALLAVSATVVVNCEAPWPSRMALVKRDYVATVTCGFFEGERFLLVDGIGITSLTSVTKQMAHLPLMLLPAPPESGLAICFGMGTTWRSLLSWGIDATAVELVPSVRDLFGFFHPDARALMADPRGRIIIDDGRRFLARSGRQYDVITLDPPPPVEAAGSSLLYSEEFYRLARRRLKPGGILQQWSPIPVGGAGQTDPAILGAIARSIVDSFPHVRAFAPVGGAGVHFLASDSPISVPSPTTVLGRIPPRAREDLLEWYPGADALGLVRSLTFNEIPLAGLLPADPGTRITDDRPFNEYFLLRRLGRD